MLLLVLQSASLLLRVDDVVSARRGRQLGGGAGPGVQNMAGPDEGAEPMEG